MGQRACARSDHIATKGSGVKGGRPAPVFLCVVSLIWQLPRSECRSLCHCERGSAGEAIHPDPLGTLERSSSLICADFSKPLFAPVEHPCGQVPSLWIRVPDCLHHARASALSHVIHVRVFGEPASGFDEFTIRVHRCSSVVQFSSSERSRASCLH